LQCIAVCCNALQSVAMHCSLLQCIAFPDERRVDRYNGILETKRVTEAEIERERGKETERKQERE